MLQPQLFRFFHLNVLIEIESFKTTKMRTTILSLSIFISISTFGQNKIKQTVETMQVAPSTNDYPGYTVIATRAFIYDEPNIRTMRKVWLTKGDKVKLMKESGQFAYVQHKDNKTGLVSNYWVLILSLKKGATI
jgi:hypothetical protein